MSRIRVIDTTGSTNADLAADQHAVEGDWLVAKRQEAGRGRQGRQWATLDGNFFGSTLVRLNTSDPAPASLSLVAGLALIDAVETAAPKADLMLKWPNDLLKDGAKLAGILLERTGDRIVAGFGVNLAAAPEIEGRRTTALAPDAVIAPQAFAPLLAGSFARLLAAWRSSEPSALIMAWMQRAHPVGTPITLHDADGRKRDGLFAGLEEDGALRLETDGDLLVIRAGDVMLSKAPSSA